MGWQWFHYPIDLHYSQTIRFHSFSFLSFITLQIYTTLKRSDRSVRLLSVSLPYRFTLLSNDKCGNKFCYLFHYPIDLHYSQTGSYSVNPSPKFHYPIDLHYSQTIVSGRINTSLFHYPIDLHYSQTSNLRKRPAIAVKSIGSIQNSQKSQSTIKRFSCSNLSKS